MPTNIKLTGNHILTISHLNFSNYIIPKDLKAITNVAATKH